MNERNRGPSPSRQAVEAGPQACAPGLHERTDTRPAADDDSVTLYGWHTVKAALDNPARRIRTPLRHRERRTAARRRTAWRSR